MYVLWVLCHSQQQLVCVQPSGVRWASVMSPLLSVGPDNDKNWTPSFNRRMTHCGKTLLLFWRMSLISDTSRWSLPISCLSIPSSQCCRAPARLMVRVGRQLSTTITAWDSSSSDRRTTTCRHTHHHHHHHHHHHRLPFGFVSPDLVGAVRSEGVMCSVKHLKINKRVSTSRSLTINVSSFLKMSSADWACYSLIKTINNYSAEFLQRRFFNTAAEQIKVHFTSLILSAAFVWAGWTECLLWLDGCQAGEVTLCTHLSHTAFFLQIFAYGGPDLTFREDVSTRHLLEVLVGAELLQDALHDSNSLQVIKQKNTSSSKSTAGIICFLCSLPACIQMTQLA